MPKTNTKGQPKIVYPSGVKELNDDLSTDDLVRRLKECAQAFQSMSQDDDNSNYIPLALYLGSEFFLEHPSKDVRLLTACSIADVFRVFAPEAPYKDSDQLKTIFEFFIQQLRGLEDPKDAIFKRYFYLLENLAWVKSFNICIELEENQSIFCQLFTLMFNIVNDNHSTKVKNFMMDMMCPLISEADSVSQELLDIILAQIIEPRKTQNKNAYSLAKDILRRTSSTIEPYIQAFFNNALILGKTSRSDVAHHLYDLIYELNSVCPSMLVAVLPQLEFKLKSNEEKERLEVSRLLARMFSDKNADLAAQNKPLWTCFLGRFNDISVLVRIRCVQYSMHFLINHSELSQDITEQLRLRQHDPEESVRYEVVMAIISAAKKDFNSVSEELLNFVKERTLDKKFKVRKEALLGLAMLYKQHSNSSELPASTLDYISWIRNKVLHGYYQSSLEDRLLVERILHTCLVPYQNSFEDRMKKLYQLFASVDDNAVKAFNEMLKCQNIVRCQLSNIVQLIQHPKSEELQRSLSSRIVLLSKNLPEPIKSQEYLRKFCALLENNKRLQTHIDIILKGSGSCSEIEHSVKEILKSLGLPVQTNTFYMTIKQLLERVAPVMIDHAGIKQLLLYVKDSLIGEGTIDAQLGLVSSAHRGLQLLHTLSFIFPGAFHEEEVYTELLHFLCADDEYAAEITLQILTNISEGIEKKYPNAARQLLPILQNFVECGSVKQAKHAVACINTAVINKEQVFGQIIDYLKQHLSHSSGYFQTALVSIGHIAYHCADLFGPQMKSIVSKIVVKELLMMDQDPPRDGKELWDDYDKLPIETKTKIEGMKLMVRWLVGLRNAVHSVASTLRLLSSVISHHGDLMENKRMSLMEKSWLRVTAASCMLKLCYEPLYADAISLEHFQTLCFVICDECEEVREKFALKLHKGLLSLKLPLDFLAAFALCGVEKTHKLKTIFKQYLIANISKRREYLKQHPIATLKLFSILPDYVLPYAIHLLAHDPSFKSYDDVPALNKIKDCLWFLMEPLMTKNENYSFSFFKRLIENIKQTKDKQAPEDDLVNLKLYAVCDLALGLVMSKTTNFVLKDFPVEPSLPSKLFTNLDKMYSNLKTYLPAELAFTPPKKSGIEMEMFGLHMKNVARKSMTVHNSRRESLSDSGSIKADDKKYSKVLLNGEKTKKLNEENEENICKHPKGNECSKQRILTNKILQQNQTAKHPLGRRRKLADAKVTTSSSLHSKKNKLSLDSSTSSVNSDSPAKHPRGRQLGMKTRHFTGLECSAEKKSQKAVQKSQAKKNNILNYISHSETQPASTRSSLEKKSHSRLLKHSSSISSNSPKIDTPSESSSPVIENELSQPVKRQKVQQIKKSQESKGNSAAVSCVFNKKSVPGNNSDGKRTRSANLSIADSLQKAKSSGDKSLGVVSSISSNSDSSENKNIAQNILSPPALPNVTFPSYSQKSKRNKHSSSNISSSSSNSSSEKKSGMGNKHISSTLRRNSPSIHSAAKGSYLRKGRSTTTDSPCTASSSSLQEDKKSKKNKTTLMASPVSSSSTSQKSTDFSKTGISLRGKEVSVVLDKLSLRKYCKRTKHSGEVDSTNTVLNKQPTNARVKHQLKGRKESVSSNYSDTKGTPMKKLKISSPGILHQQQRKSASRKCTHSLSTNIRTPTKQTLPSPAKAGITLSPTIISLSASPHSSSPEQKKLKGTAKDSQESEQSVATITSVTNNKVKKKLTLGSSAKVSSSKSSVGSGDKEFSSRDCLSKRPEVASSVPKLNTHIGTPTRVSERLSAAAKASRKESKSKKLQEFLASRKRRPSIGSCSRSSGNHKYVKKTKINVGTQKPSTKSKQAIDSPCKKSASASLLAKAIRSSALTPQNLHMNVQRNLRQK